MSWPLLINIGIGIIAGLVVNFGVRALIAFFTTKDYYEKYVSEAIALGFVEHRVKVREGLEINLAEGPSTGAPLLLIPGQGSIWQEYCRALPHLIDDFHVIVVDVHGHGKTTWNPDDYTAVQIADDLASLIEATFGEPVLIAGHSSGGLIAAVIADRHPEVVRGVLFEDPPFFSTEPDRVQRTYVYLDGYRSTMSFLAQSEERDWVCWYMPRSYWKRLFGPMWPVFTRLVTRQRRSDPDRLPLIRWVSVSINRIWESMSHPFDLRFTVGFVDNSWFRGFGQAETLRRVACPTVFLKATTRHDRRGNLLAALSDEDLTHVEELLHDNRTIRVRSSHDIHFARTGAYVAAVSTLSGAIEQRSHGTGV
ncbi:MAG: alpha/beta fold hydrolase [Leucobacter sp.]